MDATNSSQSTDAHKIIWKRKRKLLEDKANAALLIKHSNALVFRWQRGKFMCAYCPKISINLIELRSHSSEHNKLDIFETNKTRLLFPLNIDISDLVCSICNVLINGIDELKCHLNDVHAIKVNPDHTDGVIPFRLIGQELRCVSCESRFDKFMTLFIHMNEHYQSFVCDSCGKAYSAENRLRSHKAIHESGQFGCTQCDMVFSNRIAKNRHISEKHRPKNRYRCPICDEHLNSYHSRLLHLKMAHGESSEYRCTYCPSVFNSGSSRYMHIQGVHLKKRQKKKKREKVLDLGNTTRLQK